MLPLTTAIRKVERLAYSPDGTRLAAGGPTGTEVLELASGETVAMLDWARNCVVAFIHAGSSLFVAHSNRPVSLVNYMDSAYPPAVVQLGQWWGNRVHLVPMADGWIEADSGSVWAAKVVGNTFGFPPPHSVTWEYRDRPQFSRTQSMTALDNPYRVVFLGSVVEAEGRDKFLYVLDGATGELLRRHRCGYRHLDHFTGSPCGQYLVGTKRNSLVVWDANRLDLPLRRFLNDTPKQFTGVAFVPDGRHLLTTSNDRSVKAWDIATGHVVRAYDFGVGRMRSVAVAPDGLTAAAGSDDHVIVVFDLDL